MPIKITLVVLNLCLLSGQSSLCAQEAWWVDGTELQAEFVRLTDDGVVLRRVSDGREGEIPFSRLDLDGRLAALKLGKPEAFSKPLVKAPHNTLVSPALGLATSSVPFQAAAPVSAELGEQVEVHGFYIRPPVGYERMDKVSGRAGVNTMRTTWKGKWRLDGTAHTIQLVVLTPPANADLSDFNGTLRNMFAGLVDGVTGRKTSQLRLSEFTQIDGQKFAIHRWKGEAKDFGIEMHGVIYGTVFDRKVIMLSTNDIAVHLGSLPFGERSIMTFRRTRN